MKMRNYFRSLLREKKSILILGLVLGTGLFLQLEYGSHLQAQPAPAQVEGEEKPAEEAEKKEEAGEKSEEAAATEDGHGDMQEILRPLRQHIVAVALRARLHRIGPRLVRGRLVYLRYH